MSNVMKKYHFFNPSLKKSIDQLHFVATRRHEGDKDKVKEFVKTALALQMSCGINCHEVLLPFLGAFSF